jgi:hypothetical protein
MSNPHKDGTEQVRVERFTKYELPRLLALKEKVDGGAKLSEVEIEKLSDIFERARDFYEFVEKWPKYKSLVAQIIGLYHEISTKALEIESRP